MQKKPRFSFVIVSYNNEETIAGCLASIACHVRDSYEVVVVDNSPGNATVEVLQAFANADADFNLRWLKPTTNVGFARACNLGVTQSWGEYIFLLNPDTRLENDAAASLASCLESHPDAGAAGPAIEGADGAITRTCRNLPTLLGILLDAIGIDDRFGIYKLKRFSHREARAVGQIIGAAMMIRRSDYAALSGMDERFFIYFEEVDFCKRLAEAGKTVWFWPEGRITHWHGSSCEVAPTRARMIYTLRESRAKYFDKHFGSLSALGMRTVNRLEGLFKSAVSLALFAGTSSRMHWEKAKGFWSVAINRAPSSERKAHRVLAFTVKPEDAPDARYRILQYRRALEEQDISVDHFSLLPKQFFEWHKRHSHSGLRALWYPFLVLRRLIQVLTLVPRYDTVWIGREMAPLGPAILERLVLRMSKRVVLDIDDALHVADGASKSFVHRRLRDFSKYTSLARRYSAIVCGNRFLAEYFQQWSDRVHIVPTVVDTNFYGALEPSLSNTVRIGWVGTPTNAHHLEFIKPALFELAGKRTIEFIFVGLNRPLDWNLPGLHCLEWRLSTELAFFTAFDIGIMPLDDFEFTKGKSAFKLIQYMAAGLPVVASPVGANEEVVTHGLNGFLAKSHQDWVQSLNLLIDDAELRQRFGQAGRQRVRERYSLNQCWPGYAAILKGSPLRKVATEC
jgi:GT2 family glycosyltransferase/glycosyltransferase involved in cell wall biosynthesis